LDSTVVFNEIMYNPAGDADDTLEWIELYNQLAVDMDVSEWSIEGGIDYEFPNGTVVPGRGHLVLAISPDDLQAASGYAGALGPYSGKLSNGGEELRLINNDDRVMNVVSYGDNGAWPVGPDGSGASLAKRDPRAASDLADNWTASPQIGGTPGIPNFASTDPIRVTETLLDSGAPATALVPSNGTLGWTWTETGFNDGAWLEGDTGVGYDERTTYNGLLGLDLDAPPDGQPPMPMVDVMASVYVRIPFSVDVDPMQYDALTLRMKFDDGFVAFINGQEVEADRAPGRDGNNEQLLWNSGATGNHSDGAAQQFQDFDVTAFRNVLVQGGANVLAIHGLNDGTGSSDMLILPELVGENIIEPVDPDGGPGLIFNEIAPAWATDFWLEIANPGEQDVDLEGFVLTATGFPGGEYVFGAGNLRPGELLVLGEAELGFDVDADEKVFLYGPDKTLLSDARVVTDRLRGLSAAYDGRWLYPDFPSPGSANSFNFHDEVVINEVMYHAFPNLASPGTPATYQTTTLLSIDAATQWRYNDTGANLGDAWAQSAHTVDNANWFEGAALLGYETDPNRLPHPIRTPLTNPRNNNPYIVTYYFETEFQFDGNVDAIDVLQMQHVIDDGAVFYLNGVELPEGTRYRMQSGPFHSGTQANSTTGDAGYVGPVTIPKDLLQAGTNRFSVEVHQGGSNSSDIIFGAELFARRETAPGTPPGQFSEAPEEWIELYNRGNTPVNLGGDPDDQEPGWKLTGGIDFEFPLGTVIEPGEYLVVANNAETLREKYPGVEIVGDFAGTLGNQDDLIRLVDSQKNPADEVHYYERGRWPAYADGGGSSIELRDPDSDNSQGEAWAASDEGAKSQWRDYSVRRAANEPLEVGTVYNEFIFGLLDAGELLLDDVSVRRNPDGAGAEMIQNGDFSDDAVGSSPDTWRLIGNHSGTVVRDPDDASNRVLHVTAAGAQQFVHDHVETTFVGNTSIANGSEYEISFRAKWLGGNAQLNNRLYFTRMGNTIVLDVPENNGTPGARNSTFQTNVGPTYGGFGHSPLLPTAGQPVTISATADDPDGVDTMTLRWRLDGGAWNSTAMFVGADDTYAATIPGQSSGRVVQFYVQGRDALGVTSTFPADGVDSRALYEVDDGAGTSRPIDNFRLVVMAADNSALFSGVNRMSNNYVGITVICNEQEAFYDVDLRQVGSRFIRPNSGYKVRLNPDQKLYGVHSSIRFDRSGGGPREIYMKQMVNRTGGSSVSHYDDVAYVISPQYNGTILFQLARYEDVFLDSQFDNGSDGTLFELDDITYPTSPNPSPEGYKDGTGVSSPDMNYRGDNPESYRGHLLIKNNRAKDDYGPLVAMSEAIHLSGQALYDATNAVMDVDAWMRHYATQSFLGNWDTYGFRRPKNLRVYIRPEDGMVMPLYWDADLANLTDSLLYHGGSSRLDEIRDLPQNLRLFYGHMWDMMNRGFNRQYIEPWINHYNSLGAGIPGDTANKVGNRVNSARSHITSAIPQVGFTITTNGGNGFTVSDLGTTLRGDGWIDVREIRLKLDHGTPPAYSSPLEVTWLDRNSWEAAVPLNPGPNDLELVALNHQGNEVGTDTIAITSTATENPLASFLRISEIMYNPVDPSAAEQAAGFTNNDDFEFIELLNTSDLVTLGLEDVAIGGGIAYTFGDVDLLPGQRIVVAYNTDAFEMRYGTGANLAGYYENRLGNGGEQITLSDGFGLSILDFTYDDQDGWPGRADGKGAALELIAPEGSTPADYGNSERWQSSIAYGGTPGAAPQTPLGVVINEVLTHTDNPLADAIELHNVTDEPIDVGGWYLSDSWGWESESLNGDYKKFEIAEDTVIPPRGYAVFYEGHYVFEVLEVDPSIEFGGTGPKEFALDGASGDDVWLMKADAGRLTHFVDHVEFDAAANGESFGRWPNASGDLYPMQGRTLGDENAEARIGPLVISEVMYQPPVPQQGEQPQDEFVELYNPTAGTVQLFDPDQPENTWRLDGVDFNFPAGVEVPSGGVVLVVPIAPDAFRTRYGIAADVQIFGPCPGSLDNAGERLRLQRPDAPTFGQPPTIPRLLVDEADYEPYDPWPEDAAGEGSALHRLGIDLGGTYATSWEAGPPTPGVATGLEVPAASVAGRWVFYNNSAFDGDNPAANADDDIALATDKQALMPGDVATFANYTSYSLGINGVMIDLAGLAGDVVPNADDFTFYVGNNEDPAGWIEAPAPANVTLRRGAGVDGSDRVSIVFDDYAIKKEWLQVTLLAAGVGLPADDVFYFGNAVAEGGNSGGNAQVTTTDLLLARNNPRNFLDPAAIDFGYDYNRDERVNSTDVLLARNNQTNFLTALALIDLSGLDGAAAAEASPASDVSWLLEFDPADEASQKPKSSADAVDRLLTEYWP